MWSRVDQHADKDNVLSAQGNKNKASPHNTDCHFLYDEWTDVCDEGES